RNGQALHGLAPVGRAAGRRGGVVRAPRPSPAHWLRAFVAVQHVAGRIPPGASGSRAPRATARPDHADHRSCARAESNQGVRHVSRRAALMRAVMLRGPGGPDALELVDLPGPQPGPGEVRVKAQAIGVGRPDVMIRTGKYKWMPPLPAVIGNELAGVVEALGPSVATSWLGRPVLVSSRELA